jgi:hypothetical protein
MGKKFVLVDDYDGSDLPDDTKPVTLSLGRTTYSIYLSEKNHGKLMEALDPFITNAETTSTTTTAVRSAASSSAASSYDKIERAAARKWAQDTGFKFKGADGSEKTLGDRGRIPDEVMEAFKSSPEYISYVEAK